MEGPVAEAEVIGADRVGAGDRRARVLVKAKRGLKMELPRSAYSNRLLTHAPPNNSFNRSANKRVFHRELGRTGVECAPG